jgi:spore coat protein CotF
VILKAEWIETSMKISPVQKAPTKQANVVNQILEKKPRFQYDPISEELQDVNAPGWTEKATKQMDDIKKSSRKVSVQRTETKSPELSGVDRYILAKKI